MKENSIEEALKKLSTGKKIKMYELLRTFKKEGIENFVITRKKYVDVILSDYKRVLKENEELKDYKERTEYTKKLCKSKIEEAGKKLQKTKIEIEIIKKENEKFKKLMAHKNGYTDALVKDLFENCSNYVVPKSKIQEKIEEYQNMLKNLNKKTDIDRIQVINERILAYKELLESDEK